MTDRKEYFKKYYAGNKENNKIQRKKYYNENKIEINKKKKIYHKENIEKIKEYRESIKDDVKNYMVEYRRKNKNRIKEKQKEYKEKNIDKIKEYKSKYNYNYDITKYFNDRKKVDELFKLTMNIRSLISCSLKRKGYKKRSKTEQILGCSFLEFKNHIESQFEP